MEEFEDVLELLTRKVAEAEEREQSARLILNKAAEEHSAAHTDLDEAKNVLQALRYYLKLDTRPEY